MALSCRAPRCEEGARLQLAQVLQAAFAAAARPPSLPAHHWKTLNAILRCHTAALGGHLYRCADCGQDHFVAHGCRNRHCPSCQRAGAEAWLVRQKASLLPVPYFHLVFTLPHLLNPLVAQNQRALYKLLFDSASATLLQFGQGKFKAQVGLTAVLHTWSQTLSDHYHLHCIVTGGGLSLRGPQWQKSHAHYLFPVRALSQMFRAKFCHGLKELYAAGNLCFHGSLAALAPPKEFQELLRSASAKSWIVYGKKPFAGPEAVLAYLSRYTHRVALGNGRLRRLDERSGTVTFSYKDYADQGRRKKMELSLSEFLRRFCLHILPERFVKIRHYGLLGNRNRAEKIAAARAQLARPQKPAESPPGAKERAPHSPPLIRCPHCGSERLLLIEVRARAKAPPPGHDSS